MCNVIVFCGAVGKCLRGYHFLAVSLCMAPADRESGVIEGVSQIDLCMESISGRGGAERRFWKRQWSRAVWQQVWNIGRGARADDYAEK